MSDREVIAAIRRDSPWRRLALGVFTWAGLSVLGFLVMLRFLARQWDETAAVQGLVGSALVAVPATLLVMARRGRAGAGRGPGAPGEGAPDVERELGYRDARRTEGTPETIEMPPLRPGVRDFLRAYGLVLLLASGGMALSGGFAHMPGVAILTFALVAAPALTVAFAMALQARLRARREQQGRRRDARQAQALEDAARRVRVDPAPDQDMVAEEPAAEEGAEDERERPRRRGGR